MGDYFIVTKMIHKVFRQLKFLLQEAGRKGVIKIKSCGDTGLKTSHSRESGNPGACK